MKFWPGTNTVMSQANAFEWRGEPSIFSDGRINRNAEISATLTAHVDARRVTFPPVAPQPSANLERQRRHQAKLKNEFTGATRGPKKQGRAIKLRGSST